MAKRQYLLKLRLQRRFVSFCIKTCRQWRPHRGEGWCENRRRSRRLCLRPWWRFPAATPSAFQKKARPPRAYAVYPTATLNLPEVAPGQGRPRRQEKKPHTHTKVTCPRKSLLIALSHGACADRTVCGHNPSTCLFKGLLSPQPIARISYRTWRVHCKKKMWLPCWKIIMNFKTQQESIKQSTELGPHVTAWVPHPCSLISKQRKLGHWGMGRQLPQTWGHASGRRSALWGTRCSAGPLSLRPYLQGMEGVRWQNPELFPSPRLCFRLFCPHPGWSPSRQIKRYKIMR